MITELYQASYNISLNYLANAKKEPISRKALSDMVQWVVQANFLKLREEVVLGMKNALVDSQKMIFPGGSHFANWWRGIDESFFYYGDDGLIYFKPTKYFEYDKSSKKN